MAALREAQRHLDVEVEAFRLIQKDISKNHQMRQQFTLQLNENEMVQKVTRCVFLSNLCCSTAKQCYLLLRLNVWKRLDAALKSLDNKQEAKKEEVLKAQQRVQVLQAKAAPK
ncbi:hypothetical protein CBR_g48714 [Chara braunii]|uniref:Uncharacterized protein n=1 Tax=Chara braunii TaxID=69332 RepID=A0A388K4J4_CHABU|nr:hypothetical protein CBR_g48714 [Chara braunii]|eukprot:GBG64965.1 hypothetical protein CBR_g48714 [Chara braunii]